MKTQINARASKTNQTAQRGSSVWAEQNAKGRRLAVADLNEAVEKQNPLLLTRRRQQIVDRNPPAGVLVGYDNVISAAAIRGAYVQ